MRNKTCIPNAPNLPNSSNDSGANLQILNTLALENTQTGHKTPGQEDLGLTAQAQLQRNVGRPELYKVLLRLGRGAGIPRGIPAQLTLVHSSPVMPHQVSIKSTLRHVIRLFSKITDERQLQLITVENES